MRIGIDVDGVLVDTRGFMLHYGGKFFRKEPVDPSGYSIEEIFGVSGIPVLLFGLRWFFPYYCRKYPPYKGAARVYSELKKGGNTIFQITARKFALSRSLAGCYSRNMLKRWLKNNRFYYDKLIFCAEKNVAYEKLRYCKKYRINVMIEDNPETAAALAAHGITVLLFDAPYNQRVVSERIIRIKNWSEAENVLNKLIDKGEDNRE